MGKGDTKRVSAEANQQARRASKNKRRGPKRDNAPGFSLQACKVEKREARERQQAALAFGRKVNDTINGWLDVADATGSVSVRSDKMDATVYAQAFAELQGWIANVCPRRYGVLTGACGFTLAKADFHVKAA